MSTNYCFVVNLLPYVIEFIYCNIYGVAAFHIMFPTPALKISSFLPTPFPLEEPEHSILLYSQYSHSYFIPDCSLSTELQIIIWCSDWTIPRFLHFIALPLYLNYTVQFSALDYSSHLLAITISVPSSQSENNFVFLHDL